jgi:hypothetical protein
MILCPLPSFRFSDFRGKIVEAVSPSELGAFQLQTYELKMNGIGLFEDALQVPPVIRC